jgi:hypothetical protein
MDAKKTADKYIARDGGQPPRAAFDEAARHWSLLTKTRSGQVSILRDLTLYECKEAYVRLNPEFGRTYTSYEDCDPASRSPGSFGCVSFGGRLVDKNEIEQREVFGPPGWVETDISTWDPWPTCEFIGWHDERHFRHGANAADGSSHPGGSVSLPSPWQDAPDAPDATSAARVAHDWMVPLFVFGCIGLVLMVVGAP